MMRFLREHGEAFWDYLKAFAFLVAANWVAYMAMPPEFLRVAAWKWITWKVLKVLR